ncbi:MAG: hypothetical protein Q7S52_00825 [bacterium]|nr:hypothetical protein [bacterium]
MSLDPKTKNLIKVTLLTLVNVPALLALGSTLIQNLSNYLSMGYSAGVVIVQLMSFFALLISYIFVLHKNPKAAYVNLGLLVFVYALILYFSLPYEDKFVVSHFI